MVLDYTQQGGLLTDEREIFNNLSLQCADLWGGFIVEEKSEQREGFLSWKK